METSTPSNKGPASLIKTKTDCTPLAALTGADYIPLPKRGLDYRGLTLTRSPLLRAARKGELETLIFRQPGSRRGRRVITRASLDAYVSRCLVSVPLSRPSTAA
jgi:hypothetical protein